MSADIQQVKNRIGVVKNQVKDQEGQLAEWEEQLVNLKNIVKCGGYKPPDDIDLQGEIQNSIDEIKVILEPLYAELKDLHAKLPAPPGASAPKFDVEKHPVLKKMVEKTDAEPDTPVNFNTGDVVEAQWRDKQWYKAKIQQILGSRSAPKYLVKFIEYDDSMTVDRENVRAIPIKRKREPEPPAQPAAPVTSTPQVISGPVSLNPEVKKAKVELPVADDAPMPRRHNIPNRKTLDKTVNSWKTWNSKGVGKKIAQKDSMFRSSTNVGSRVGFTGSGNGMTESQKRVRYNAKADMDADEAAEKALKAAKKAASQPPPQSSYTKRERF
ncbi:unnamed protein product [Periconia digitata]|uniref:Tudor domain-containing protein n=1 Tax=Periconia digitata TaxID=1303443 RepID=A0A9W4XFX8_9PLEO|nr:unnamed protein product [Periconia digitata]